MKELVLTVDYSLSHPYALRYKGEKQIHLMYRFVNQVKNHVGDTKLYFDPKSVRAEDRLVLHK